MSGYDKMKESESVRETVRRGYVNMATQGGSCSSELTNVLLEAQGVENKEILQGYLKTVADAISISDAVANAMVKTAHAENISTS